MRMLCFLFSVVVVLGKLDDFECNREKWWWKKKGALDDYYQTRDKCEWTSYLAQDFIEDLHLEYTRNTREYSDFHTEAEFRTQNNYGDFHNAEVQSCHLKETEQQGLVIERIGPFSTMGGVDWLAGSYNNVGKFREIWADYRKTHEDAKLSVLSKILAPVYWGNYSVISNPPVHLHHAHVYPGVYAGKGFASRFLQTHGDAAVCQPEEGGLDCFIEDFRGSGYGVTFADKDYPMCIDWEINDNRPFPSPTLIYWWEIGIRYTFAPVKPALISLYKNPNKWPHDPVKNHHMQQLSVMFFEPDVPSAHWFTFHWGATRGKILQFLWHAHQNNDLHALYLFRNTDPDGIGLNAGKFKLPGPATFLRLPDVGESIESFEQHIWKNGGSTKLECRTFAEVQDKQPWWPPEQTFDRRMPICCRPNDWIVTEDQWNTVVTIYRGTTNKDVDDANTHISLWTYLAPPSDKPEDGAVVTIQFGGTYAGSAQGFDSRDIPTLKTAPLYMPKYIFNLLTTGEGPWLYYFNYGFWTRFFFPKLIPRTVVFAFLCWLFINYGPAWMVRICGLVPCCCCCRWSICKTKGKKPLDVRYNQVSQDDTA